MRKPIGTLFIERGLLRESQVREIVNYGKSSGLRFGDAAIALKVLTEEKLIQALGKNSHADFFFLDVEHFPRETMHLFSVDEMIFHGALPLGFKKEVGLFKSRNLLNIGLVNPARVASVRILEATAAAKMSESDRISACQVFLISPDQLIQALGKVYQVSADDIIRRSEDQVDEILFAYLERIQ